MLEFLLLCRRMRAPTHLCNHRQQQVARGVPLIFLPVQGKGMQLPPQLLQAYLSEACGMHSSGVGCLATHLPGQHCTKRAA